MNLNFRYAPTTGRHHFPDQFFFEFFTVMGHLLLYCRPLFANFTFSIYRTTILTQGGGRARTPRTVIKPKGYKAEAPNQVWSWDITYLASAVRGSFYYLYMVEDIYSRKIVCWEVHEEHNALRGNCCHHQGLG